MTTIPNEKLDLSEMIDFDAEVPCVANECAEPARWRETSHCKRCSQRHVSLLCQGHKEANQEALEMAKRNLWATLFVRCAECSAPFRDVTFTWISL